MLTARRNLKSLLVLGGLALTANGAMAQQFDGGIPATWTCTGNCGTSADVIGPSIVTPLPTAYGWVSSYAGVDAVSPFPNASVPDGGLGGIGNTNGSVLRSKAFTATAGEVLQFQFNYVTSDGGTFADYAWARLLNAGSGSEAAIIFTARTNTTPGADVVPGFGLPNPNTELTPSNVPIIDAGYDWNTNTGPRWSPLGESSGTCGFTGCGYTGWVGAKYNMAETGNYVLEFGVTNWDDQVYDSGMAFNSVVIGTGTGQPGDDVEIDDDSREVITAVPEPETYAMLLAGLGLLGFTARRRKQKSA